MSKATIILLALIMGLGLGIVLDTRVQILTEIADIVGTLWLNGLRMTVVPLVVAMLVTGIAQTAAAARAGRLALRAVVTMMVILWASATMAAFVTPSLLAGFPMPAEAGNALKSALSSAPATGEVTPFSDFIRAIVPTNPINAAANDAILPLIVFTMAFAFAILRLPEEKRKLIGGVFEALGDAMLIVINWVLAIAPIGVFALAYVVGAKAGAAALGALAHYVVIVSATGSVVWMSAFGLAVLGARRSPLAFFRASIPAQAVAISTQSSLVSLPAMLRGVASLGVPAATADLVLPVAVAIFRATGPAMNMAVAIYVAHWMGVELSPWALAAGVAAAATTTLGAVSLPGTVSFVTSIAPISLAMGVPVEPLALLIAVETFPDIMRTLGNVTMDMAVTATISERSEDDTASIA
ncbi:MAG: dicarboxylate/amino acid:cation symporter [Chakrabartia sp.]